MARKYTTEFDFEPGQTPYADLYVETVHEKRLRNGRMCQQTLKMFSPSDLTVLTAKNIRYAVVCILKQA